MPHASYRAYTLPYHTTLHFTRGFHFYFIASSTILLCLSFLFNLLQRTDHAMSDVNPQDTPPKGEDAPLLHHSADTFAEQPQ